MLLRETLRFEVAVTTVRQARRGLVGVAALYVLGAMLSQLDSTPMHTVANLIAPRAKELLALTPPERAASLFVHNLVVALVAVSFVRPLGLVPIAIALLNGYLFGLVGTRFAGSHSVNELLLRFAPHGVFELLALLLAAGSGVSGGGKLYP